MLNQAYSQKGVYFGRYDTDPDGTSNLAKSCNAPTPARAERPNLTELRPHPPISRVRTHVRARTGAKKEDCVNSPPSACAGVTL